MNPQQKFIFTMDAWRGPASSATQDHLNWYNSAYMNYIVQNADRVAGIFPFVWQSIGTGHLGASSMPKVRYYIWGFAQSFVDPQGAQLPSGLFYRPSKTPGDSGVYTVNSLGYCRFASRTDLDKIVALGLSTRVSALMPTHSSVRLKNTFLGDCSSSMATQPQNVSATVVSKSVVKFTWTANPATSIYYHFVASSNDTPLPKCVASTRVIKNANVSSYQWSGLVPGRKYNFGLCAKDKESKIISDPVVINVTLPK